MDTGSPRRRYSKPVLFAYEHPRDRLKSERAVTAIEASPVSPPTSCSLSPSVSQLCQNKKKLTPSATTRKRPGGRLFGTGSGGHHRCGGGAADVP
jgi:hypothetical protein